MKPAFWARRTHKWIGLVIGVQALLWMASGTFMAIVSLAPITEARLNAPVKPELNPASGLLDAAALSQRFPGMTSYQLTSLMGRPVFQIDRQAGSVLVDAHTGGTIEPLDEEDVRAIATSLYKGDAPPAEIAWLDTAPREVSREPAPMWSVTYDDDNATTLYLSPTGELLGHRHAVWRWFDMMWMLHIMDYRDRADASNTLLRVASVVALLFCFSGIWLLFYSFRRKTAA